VFESIAAVGPGTMRLGGGSRPLSITATTTVADFFSVLRLSPAIGRAFTAEESQPGRNDVAVLSHGFAESQFGSPAQALGKTLDLNGRMYRVIGVMPPQFQVNSWFPASSDVLVPLAWTPQIAAIRGDHNLLVIARLRAGVTVRQAQSEMTVLSERLARQYPEENTGWGAAVATLTDSLVGDVRPALLTLLGAVGFVLLIACANVANMVLARTITRRKELAIRAALGANARRLVFPVLLETTLLALAGGLLGLLLAGPGQSLIMKALADQMPRAIDVETDARVFGFTLLASALAGVAAGLIASWRLARADLNESLKQGSGKTDAFSGGARTRGALVVAEVALSLVLLVGAGLMIRSLWALQRVDPGFVSSNVLTMSVPIPESKDGAQRNRFYDDFLPQVRRLPRVISAAAISTLPLQTGSQQPIVIEGRPAEVFALQPNVGVRRATPGYLATMRIPLLAGRDFEEADTAADAKAVILISQSMARKFWPDEDPIGKRLRISFTPDTVREVVGIAGDVKERGLDSLEPVTTLYVPVRQNDRGGLSLVVRGDAGVEALAPEITRVLQQIDPDLPVRNIRSLDELVADSLAQDRFGMYLFVALGGLACLLAAVGIYSVLAYSVRRRVQEIGIRIALGAKLSDVLRLVVIEGMKPTAVGIVLGTLGAWLLGGILSRLVFGVTARDPYTFAAVALLLAIVALMACLIPAYRATRVEPLTALRSE
jgi:predicted permease